MRNPCTWLDVLPQPQGGRLCEWDGGVRTRPGV